MNLGSLKPFFEPHLLSEIDRFGIVKQVKKGDILIDIGEQIQFITRACVPRLAHDRSEACRRTCERPKVGS